MSEQKALYKEAMSVLKETSRTFLFLLHFYKKK